MKKIRSAILVLISIIVLSTLTGCGEKKQENEKNMGKTEQTEPLATTEYIIEKFGLTEEDLKGIDLDRLVEYYGFTEEVINEKTKETIVANLMTLQEIMERKIEEAKYNLSYLVEAPEFEGEYPSFEDIKYLAYFQSDAESGYSFLYDFDNGVIYYTMGGRGVYEDYRRARETYTMTNEFRNKMIQALKDEKVSEWDYHYEEDTSAEPVYWYFGMEFKDGTVISNTGVEKVPETFEEVTKTIWSVREAVE